MFIQFYLHILLFQLGRFVMKNLFFCIIGSLLFFSIDANSQSCECTDCPVPIINNSITTSCLDISGLTNTILETSGQGVCGIEIQFDHTWLPEVSFTLIAPNGSSVILVSNSGGGSTPNSIWDIDFVRCSDSADPDTGFPPVFDPSGYSNNTFTGSYYPAVGCFEDLSGDANGTWKLEVEDYFIADIGEVTMWSLIFCDGTGTDCGADASCEADGGTYDTSVQNICEYGYDNITAPDVSGQAPLADYGYTFIISNNSSGMPADIISYSDNADFTGIQDGSYWVCGLSYLVADASLLPTPNGTLTNDDIQDDIDNMLYCADLSSDCYLVIVENAPEPAVFSFPDTLCVGEYGEFI